jgi:hypothetical protein
MFMRRDSTMDKRISIQRRCKLGAAEQNNLLVLHQLPFFIYYAKSTQVAG